MSQHEQLELFDVDKDPEDNGSSFFSDPSFSNNKSLPVHRWVPWIAGFSSDFVSNVIKKYLESPGIILDPFAGVGTTLVDSLIHGHKAIGFEINPYAALACEVKVDSYNIDVGRLEETINDLKKFYYSKLEGNYEPISNPPEGFNTRSEFYSPKVLRKVLILQDYVQEIREKEIKNVFRLAFASTMVKYSNYSYEPSLGRRVSAGKSEIIDFKVINTILNKLDQITTDIRWFKQNLPDDHRDALVYNESFFKSDAYLEKSSIDLVITSPPYLNNYHYNRNTRPQLYWLGYANKPKDIKPLEYMNFGKYWQTVRNEELIEINFSLPKSDLKERLDKLRETNKGKGVYGGNGWANYAASYFNDCYKFSQKLKKLLKPGGSALVVIGNSILQGIMIPTDEYFGKIAESVGLDLVRIAIPRAERVGSSIINSDVRVNKAKTSEQLYEAVVELRLPR